MMFDGIIERLNLWGDHLARIAWPLFWQSNLLIVGMFLVDLFLRRNLRPSVRHALWLVVLVKLLLPPSFALPSGIGWWLRPREAAPAKPPTTSYVVTYGSFHEPRSSRREEAPASFLPVLPAVRLSTPARALLASAAISATLLIIMFARWRHLRRQLRQSEPAPIWLEEIVADARNRARCRRSVRLSLTDATVSPALCGLFRPIIILPTALVKQLTPPQLRAVLLHELFHLRNGDVWINCFQSLLQIVFWWHPFLWFANARIRRIREEVVDDSVRLALAEEAETYAPTLLEVARLALARPLATLGLVGILESRHALKQRVDRLVNFPAPRRVGLSIISGLAILAFASVALPMGQAPPKSVKSVHTSNSNAATMLVTLLSTNELHSMVAEKNVVIQNETNQFTGDKAVYTATNGILELTGNPAWRAGTRQGTGVLVENGKAAESAKLAWDIQPISDNGWIEYDAASGIATTTNGAVVKYGDTTITADHITVNHETGEVVAEGSVQLLLGGAQLPMGSRFSTNVKNLQFAQNQPSVINPTRTVQTASGRRRIFNKLQAIRLDHVSFDNLPLSEVVNYLQGEAKKRDPEGKGINFILNPNTDLDGPPAGTIDPATGQQVATGQVEPADINGVGIRILPELNDVRIIDVLDAIVKVADKRIRFTVEDYGVSFRLGGNVGPAIFSRVIKVDPNVFAQGLESVVGFSVGNFQTGGQGGGGQGNSSGVTVPRVQVAPKIGGQGAQGGQGGAQGGAGGISGVTRPTAAISPQAVRQFFVNAGVDLTPPKSVFFNDRAGTLLVHATLNDLDIIEKAVGALSTTAAQPATTRIGQTPSNPVPPATNQAKLPVLGDLPVAESSSQTKASADPSSQMTAMQKKRERLDALYTQLNDLLAKYTEKHPFVQATRNEIETLQKQLAKLPPGITNSPTMASQVAGSLSEVRTARVATANSPQQITHTPNVGTSEKLFTRAIIVDPALKKAVNLADDTSPQEVITAFRKMLLEAGLELQPPKNIFYNDYGVLLVRATAQELEFVDNFIRVLNVSPPQISIRAKIVELSEADAKLAFSSLKEVPSSNSGSNTTTNSTVGLAEVLSDPQFRVILHELEQRDTVDLRSESSVTTLSGRQVQIQNVDMQSIVTLNRQALTSPGVTSSNLLQTTPIFSGPVLDIIPAVRSDGMTVSLEATATVTEFLGYDQPPKGDSTFVYVDGKTQSITPPLPHIRVRSLHNSAKLYDGQTLMLGLPSDVTITYDKEAKPTTQQSDSRKELLVFLTATIIDPVGNPIHSGDPLLQVPDQR